MGCNSLRYSCVCSISISCSFRPSEALGRIKYKAWTCRVQVLQSRSYCLKLPNTSSHTEVSFTSKLLTSALSKAVLQSPLYTHCCSSRELHVKQRIHSSAATSSLHTIQAEDVQTTQLNGTKRKTWTLR